MTKMMKKIIKISLLKIFKSQKIKKLILIIKINKFKISNYNNLIK